MKVWLPTAALPALPGRLEGQADVTVSFRGPTSRPEAVHDGILPRGSADQSTPLCHWWPHQGTQEWVQYSWKYPVALSGTEVFWFDDTQRGECHLPASWELLYRSGNAWKPVQAKTGYPVLADKWSEVTFAPIQTTMLRLNLTLQTNFTAAVHEWRVRTPED